MNANTRSRPGTAWRWGAAVLAVLICLAPVAQAQQLTGNIIGNVTDEQGAIVPGAFFRGFFVIDNLVDYGTGCFGVVRADPSGGNVGQRD